MGILDLLVFSDNCKRTTDDVHVETMNSHDDDDDDSLDLTVVHDDA